MERVDLWLATRGYLRTPAGEVRHVLELDEVAKDLETSEVEVYWDALDGRPIGYCYPESRIIVLAERLIHRPPWFIRRVLSHELGHITLGSYDEESVKRWQRERYGEKVEPVG